MDPTLPLLQALNADFAAAALVAFLFAATVGLAELARALGAAAEHTRKGVHIAAGLIAALTPPLFVSLVVPATLTGSLIFVFGISRARGWLLSVNGVQRASVGTVAYAAVGFGLLVATQGEAPYFTVPMLVLAVGDATAALVGQRFGRLRFCVGDTVRSVEGSAALFLSAFAMTCAGLAFANVGAPRLVLLALIVAAVATLAEAVCSRGWDNAVLPLSVFATLHMMMPLDDVGLVPVAAMLTVLVPTLGFVALRTAPVPRAAARR